MEELNEQFFDILLRPHRDSTKEVKIDYQELSEIIGLRKYNNYTLLDEFMSDHLDYGGLEEINEVFKISKEEINTAFTNYYNAPSIVETLGKCNEVVVFGEKFDLIVRLNKKRYRNSAGENCMQIIIRKELVTFTKETATEYLDIIKSWSYSSIKDQIGFQDYFNFNFKLNELVLSDGRSLIIYNITMGNFDIENKDPIFIRTNMILKDLKDFIKIKKNKEYVIYVEDNLWISREIDGRRLDPQSIQTDKIRYPNYHEVILEEKKVLPIIIKNRKIFIKLLDKTMKIHNDNKRADQPINKKYKSINNDLVKFEITDGLLSISTQNEVIGTIDIEATDYNMPAAIFDGSILTGALRNVKTTKALLFFDNLPLMIKGEKFILITMPYKI